VEGRVSGGATADTTANANASATAGASTRVFAGCANGFAQDDDFLVR